MSSEKNPTEYTAEEKETIKEVVKLMDEAENKVAPIQLNYSGTLVHKGFARDDLRQKMVAYAYKLGGLDFVKVIECENGNRNIKAVGDSGKAFGLCQMNTRYHRLPEGFKENRVLQVEYCYKKWRQGTKFYGPSRIVKGVRCSSYVADRFILE